MARSLEARIRELERAASKAVHAAKNVSAIADLVVRSAGYRPPEPDADPEPTVTPKGPRPLPPSTAPRPVTLTHLPDGRAILEVGDSRIDFSEREIEVLTWMLVPKTNIAPAGATAQEKPMSQLKASAVARHVSEMNASEVGVAVRDAAREAARQWGQEHSGRFSEAPADFGKKVAEVYLAVAAEVSAGFEPGIERPGANS